MTAIFEQITKHRLVDRLGEVGNTDGNTLILIFIYSIIIIIIIIQIFKYSMMIMMTMMRKEGKKNIHSLLR